MFKLLVYIMVMIAVIWVLDGLNLNGLFKKNRITQAKIFYMMMVFSLTYLVANFIIEFLTVFK